MVVRCLTDSNTQRSFNIVYVSKKFKLESIVGVLLINELENRKVK